MSQINIGLRLDGNLVEHIDAARGDVPRARWITLACERALPNDKPDMTRREAGELLSAASNRLILPRDMDDQRVKLLQEALGYVIDVVRVLARENLAGGRYVP